MLHRVFWWTDTNISDKLTPKSETKSILRYLTVFEQYVWVYKHICRPMYVTSTAQGDSVRQTRVKTSVYLPYDTGWCGTQSMVTIFWVLTYIEWTEHYREAKQFRGPGDGRRLSEILFQDIPTFGKLVKREADTAMLRTNVPLSDNRIPATLDVSRAQQPATWSNRTPPPPFPLGEVSFVEQMCDQFYCATELRWPPQNIGTVAHRLQICSSERTVKHSVYETSSAVRSRIYVHLQSVFYCVLSHDLRHSCPARTKDKVTTWYTVRGQRSIPRQIRNITSCATFVFICFIITKQTGWQKYVLGTRRIF
jgi:hypothetical protein